MYEVIGKWAEGPKTGRAYHAYKTSSLTIARVVCKDLGETKKDREYFIVPLGGPRDGSVKL